MPLEKGIVTIGVEPSCWKIPIPGKVSGLADEEICFFWGTDVKEEGKGGETERKRRPTWGVLSRPGPSHGAKLASARPIDGEGRIALPPTLRV